tara:strand:- start:13 stop:1470 length:1458 start_codon:yes stop_codon:yes gene_type:complete
MAYRPFDKEPVEVPLDPITKISSNRGFGPGSISLTFTRGVAPGEIRKVMDLLTDQTVVQLQVKRKPGDEWRQLNLCHVSSASTTIHAKGEESWSPELVTLDGKLQNQVYFISLPNGAKKLTPEEAAGLPEGSFPRALMQFGESFKGGVKSLKRLIENFWNEIIVTLMNPEQYGTRTVVFGGKRLVGAVPLYSNVLDLDAPAPYSASGSQDALSTLKVFSTPSYTEQFISFFSFLNQISIGNSPNFYQIISSLATAPLYEWFFDPLQGNGVLDEETNYTVKNSQGLFIFRKTPFFDMFDQSGKWIEPPETITDIHQLNYSHKDSDIYTGVHVGLTAFDLGANAVVFKPKWSGLLGATHGHRPLQIKMDGIKPGDMEPDQITDALSKIQDRLFAIFCDNKVPRRNASVSASCTFDFFRVGQPYKIETPKSVKKDYGSYGYVTQVKDTFSIQEAEASSSVSLKWIDRLSGIPSPSSPAKENPSSDASS